MGEEEFDGFLFWLKASSSETNTNKELVIASPVVAVYFEEEERLKQCQSLRVWFALWSLDTAWVS